MVDFISTDSVKQLEETNIDIKDKKLNNNIPYIRKVIKNSINQLNKHKERARDSEKTHDDKNKGSRMTSSLHANCLELTKLGTAMRAATIAGVTKFGRGC